MCKPGAWHVGPLVGSGAGEAVGKWICVACRHRLTPVQACEFFRADVVVKRIIVAAHVANVEQLKRGA